MAWKPTPPMPCDSCRPRPRRRWDDTQGVVVSLGDPNGFEIDGFINQLMEVRWINMDFFYGFMVDI